MRPTRTRTSAASTYVQQFDVQGLRLLASGAGAVLAPQGKVTGIGSKCLDVKGGKAANGTQIQLYTCNGSAAQSWILGKDGTLRALGKCLDDARNAGANGDKISLYDCNGTCGPALVRQRQGPDRPRGVGQGARRDRRVHRQRDRRPALHGEREQAPGLGHPEVTPRARSDGRGPRSPHAAVAGARAPGGAVNGRRSPCREPRAGDSVRTPAVVEREVPAAPFP